MSIQTEQALEKELINRLEKLGYRYVSISNSQGLLTNFKRQLEKHNRIALSDGEFQRILSQLQIQKDSIFEKAQKLRQKRHYLLRDNGEHLYFSLLNTGDWCQNEYQVSSQIRNQGGQRNRYDVTLLINGLPLVQIELKRRGLELKEAFNQVVRYQRESYSATEALFEFVQIFVISNGVNTKYFSNFELKKAEYLQTFHWTDEQNNRLNNILNGFADVFLEPCHISKMICKYMVLNETEKRLMVLRPYQYYAVENIIKKVQDNEVLGQYNVKKNGYIWHTTGSGKTLTSFKVSQILSEIPSIQKVVFVVDRRDLDYQTNQQYDRFSKNSVSSTTNTGDLIKKFKDLGVSIIVTTIQKLNNVISSRNLAKMESVKDKRMVFIFDECHRSHFGEIHRNIVNYFTKIQLFGFTGTPILAENANGERTTVDLFGQCLHKYLITDAIHDQNVLKFAVEYYKTFKTNESAVLKKEAQASQRQIFEQLERREAIVDGIIKNHDKKTQNRKFHAMMCAQDVDSVIQYYEIFKQKKQNGKHNLRVITIFSLTQNEEEWETQAEYGKNENRRDLLQKYVMDFNQMFNETQSVKDTEGFYNYYNAVARKSKNNQIDILLVANMFLTGFDSKYINTLYVDKNLQYHGLIQAFSRTNRILDKNKTQGNIVCFRNLKEQTDQAIILFSNKDAVDKIVTEPYETNVIEFNKKAENLFKIVPDYQAVDRLFTEQEKSKFIFCFRDLMRLLKKMEQHANFNWDDLRIKKQLFNDYTSKYLDLKEAIGAKLSSEKSSILDDIDFEIELIQLDVIDVDYINHLLNEIKSGSPESRKRAEKEMQNVLNINLRDQKLFFEKFIKENLPYIEGKQDIYGVFTEFFKQQEQKAFQELTETEKLYPEKTRQLLERWILDERTPLMDDILKLRIEGTPKIREREEIGERILNKISNFMKVFSFLAQKQKG